MRDDGGMNWDEDGGVRKMSGCGAGCCDPGSLTATDDPGKSLTREKSTPLPPSRLSKEES